MKTLEDLLADRDARAAVDTLLAREFSPDVVQGAMAYCAATGTRRSPATEAFHARQDAARRSYFQGGDA